MINLFCVRPKRFNVGNEAINFGLRNLLRSAFGAGVNLIPIPAVESEEEGSVSGLRARTVHEMNQYGHGVVVGGGNLYENGQLDVDLHAVSRLRPPLLLFSLSHGRIYDRLRRLTPRTDAMPDGLIVGLNRLASISVARDDATLAHLRGLGVDHVLLGGCPTLLLDQALGDPVHGASSGALVSIRSPQLMSVPLHHQARVHGEVRRIVGVLRSRGFDPVRLLCHDKRDMAFASSFDDVEYVLPDDVRSYLEVLRHAELVVSFRLHAFVPCMSFGTPAINISYDERSSSLVRTIGLESWDIDLIREDDVASAVADRCDRLDQLEALRAAAKPTWAELERTMRAAIERFGEQVQTYVDEAPAT